jgi:hypothetical protein
VVALTGFVAVPVSPALVTSIGSGTLVGLMLNPLNEALPSVAIIDVLPARVAPVEPAGLMLI